MLFNQINPFVRKALVGNLNRSDTYDVYTKIKSADCRLFYMISGEGYINIEGVRYPILPGTTVSISGSCNFAKGKININGTPDSLIIIKGGGLNFANSQEVKYVQFSGSSLTYLRLEQCILKKGTSKIWQKNFRCYVTIKHLLKNSATERTSLF